MKENQVRSQLIQTFVSMDAALQYYCLQKPTLVTSYDTMAIQVAAVRQMQSSVSALENFPSRPVYLSKPIDFTVPNVAVNDLLPKEGCTIPVPLSSLPRSRKRLDRCRVEKHYGIFHRGPTRKQ